MDGMNIIVDDGDTDRPAIVSSADRIIDRSLT